MAHPPQMCLVSYGVENIRLAGGAGNGVEGSNVSLNRLSTSLPVLMLSSSFLTEGTVPINS